MTRLHDNGFTILEMLFALAVLGIGILGYVSLQVAALRSNENASRFSEAALVNQIQMEYFTMVSFGDITESGGYMKISDANFPNLFAMIPSEYTLEYRVSNTWDYDMDGSPDAMELHLKAKDKHQKVRSKLTLIKTRI